MWSSIRCILGLLGFHWATGNLTVVVSGHKSIKITTGFHPKEVWLSLKQPGGIPVCQAEMDCIDYRILPDGFVLFVNISSEYREIDWIATGRGKKHKHHCHHDRHCDEDNCVVCHLEALNYK